MLTDDEIRAAFDALLPRRTPGMRTSAMGAGSDDLEAGRAYLAGAAEGGWAVPRWSKPHGGREASGAEAQAIARVAREYAVPDLYVYAVGLGMVGPCLQTHGSTEQQDRWLRSIADGSEIWCQMFSEPEAGSDLANVGTRAERDGDEWVFSGQKVWTSRGMWARWGLCLARTDPDVPKHAGLTMFAIDMQAPGVEVRPLVQMNRDQHFSEVFVSEARMPDDARIGGFGEGWKVAMTVLAHERAQAGGGGGGGERRQGGLPGWLAALAAAGQLDDPSRRDRAVQVLALGEVARLSAARAAAEAASGRPGPGGSGAKLRTVAKYCGEAYLTKDAHGAAGMLDTDEGHVEFMTAPSMSIRGGTDEIQRNILGERVLGLPGEPRVDRDVPWSRSRQGVI